VHATGSTQPAENTRGRAHRKIHGLPYLRGNCGARTRVQPASMHVAEHARQQGGDAAWREGRLGARGTGAAPNMPWPPILTWFERNGLWRPSAPAAGSAARFSSFPCAVRAERAAQIHESPPRRGESHRSLDTPPSKFGPQTQKPGQLGGRVHKLSVLRKPGNLIQPRSRQLMNLKNRQIRRFLLLATQP